jgi:molybdenum cofactor cytidylyltransferase
MRLSEALRVETGQSVAFIGAGGKSSAICTLAKELKSKGPVVSTTSTKLGLAQTDLAEEHIILKTLDLLDGVGAYLRSGRSVLVTNDQVPDEPKWSGLSLIELERLREICREEGAILLIEADGARRKSLKAPAEHEPVVPEWVDLVVSIAGLDVIGKPFTPEYCHRAELAKEILGIEGDARIEYNHLSELLRAEHGGLKGAPPSSTVRVILRQSDSSEDIEIGRKIASEVLTSERIQNVVTGTLNHERPVSETLSRTAGVVLAAGVSTRLEGPKQLLSFKGKPLIVHVVGTALEGGLDPIIVVVGEHEERIRQALEGYPIRFVRNPDPNLGQGSSLQVGVNGIAPNVEAAVFLLADMPLVTGELITELIMRHRSSLSPIIVPYADGKRGNPVLFDKVTFEELRRVTGDRGGRAIFSQFSHERLAWDASIHFDVDTQEDAERLRGME